MKVLGAVRQSSLEPTTNGPTRVETEAEFSTEVYKVIIDKTTPGSQAQSQTETDPSTEV